MFYIFQYRNIKAVRAFEIIGLSAINSEIIIPGISRKNSERIAAALGDTPVVID